MAFDCSGDLYVTNNAGGSVSEFTPGSAITLTAGGVVIRASLPTLPIALGGSAAGGIGLSSAELAQIYTTASGTVTIGDRPRPATSPSQAPAGNHRRRLTVVMQNPAGAGQIILNGNGLNGNGTTVTLLPGSGGIAAAIANGTVPLTTQGFNATGWTLTPTLNVAPSAGAQLTLINNTSG